MRLLPYPRMFWTETHLTCWRWWYGLVIVSSKEETRILRGVKKIEDMAYENLSEKKLIFVLDIFINFFWHFKYLGTWISFSLRNNQDVAKRLAAANASMGAMIKIWDDNHVETYSKHMLFRATSCNLLLWGRESRSLRESLLEPLEVFLHRGIRRILKINMCQIIDWHIKNNSILEMFYNTPTVQNQIAFCQLTYLDKLFLRKTYQIPTRLLTAWCEHPRKVGRPLLTNKQIMVRNIQLVTPGIVLG